MRRLLQKSHIACESVQPAGAWSYTQKPAVDTKSF